MNRTDAVDLLRQAIRTRHYSIRTEKAYAQWLERFLSFAGNRDPTALGAADVARFLSHLAVKANVAASTQNQALNALVFFFRHVAQKEIGQLPEVVRAKRPQRLPVVLTPSEVERVLSRLEGTFRLMGALVYGAGLRLRDCVRLRVKDLDFAYKTVTVRDGKGKVDRVTVLPDSLAGPLREHLERVRGLHSEDLAEGFGRVYLPFALARKYPNADREWGWQYVFPSARRSRDPRSGVERRHHVHASSLQKAIKAAVRKAGLTKPATCHTLRHSFTRPVHGPRPAGVPLVRAIPLS